MAGSRSTWRRRRRRPSSSQTSWLPSTAPPRRPAAGSVAAASPHREPQRSAMPTIRSADDYTAANGRRRSAEWFDRNDLDGFLHRSWLKSEGMTDTAFRGRPIIGICNSWSELVNCNVHLRGLAESVKRGVLQAGGFPLEFPVMSLGESLMKPTTMLYRNLMAMDVEESIRAYPLDGVVLLTGCDKTNPASILGAASANIPAIAVTGGPMLHGHWRGKDLGSCSDCGHYHAGP